MYKINFFRLFLFLSIFASKIYSQPQIDEKCNEYKETENQTVPDEECRIESDSDYPQYSIGYSFNNGTNFGLKHDKNSNLRWVATMKNNLATLEFPSESRFVLERQKYTYTSILKFNGYELYRTPDIWGRKNFAKYCPSYSNRFTEQGEFQTYVNVDFERTYECLGIVNLFPFKDYRINSSNETKDKGKKLILTPHANFYIRDVDGNVIWDFFTNQHDKKLMDKVINHEAHPCNYRPKEIANYYSIFIDDEVYNTPERLTISKEIRPNNLITNKFASSHFDTHSVLYFDPSGDVSLFNSELNYITKTCDISKVWSTGTSANSNNDILSRGQKVVWDRKNAKFLVKNINEDILFEFQGIKVFGETSSLGVAVVTKKGDVNERTDIIQFRTGDDFPLASMNHPDDFYPFPLSPKSENTADFFSLDEILHKPNVNGKIKDYYFTKECKSCDSYGFLIRYLKDKIIIAQNFEFLNEYIIAKEVQVLDVSFLTLREAFSRLGFEEANNEENKYVKMSFNPWSLGKIEVIFSDKPFPSERTRRLIENEILGNSHISSSSHIRVLESEDGKCTLKHDIDRGYILENNEEGISKVIIDANTVGEEGILTIVADGSLIIKDVLGNNIFNKPILWNSSNEIPVNDDDDYSLFPEFNYTTNTCGLFTKNLSTDAIHWSNQDGGNNVIYFDFPTEGPNNLNFNQKLVDYNKDLLNDNELRYLLSSDGRKLNIMHENENRIYSKEDKKLFFNIEEFDSSFNLND